MSIICLNRFFILAVLASNLAIAADTLPAAMTSGGSLAAGDLLDIQVYGQPALTTRVRISADGIVAMPLIGKVDGVIGLRDLQLADRIAAALKDGYLPHANVSVMVAEAAPRRAHVLGSVVRQGRLELSPYTPITASQGIAECGGFSEDGDQSGVRVLRPGLDGTYLVLQVPSPADIAKGVKAPELQSGDLVLVPKLSSVTAFVLGRVARPGAVTLPAKERLTVSKAISLAGGFEKFALRGEVQLLRLGEAARKIDVESFLVGKSADDPALQAGDSIYVVESKF